MIGWVLNLMWLMSFHNGDIWTQRGRVQLWMTVGGGSTFANLGRPKTPPEHYQELGKMPGNWNTCLAFRLHLALRFPASGTMRQEIVEVTQSVALCEGIPKPWPTWPRMNDQQGTERKHRPESQCAEAWPFLLLKPTRRQVGSGSYPS